MSRQRGFNLQLDLSCTRICFWCYLSDTTDASPGLETGFRVVVPVEENHEG